jgi:hypothetical protein
LIERFADRWNWEALSDNAALPWSLDLLERFGDRWPPSAARHLEPLWERLRRQDLVDLMQRAPITPAASQENAEFGVDGDNVFADSGPAPPSQDTPESDDELPF